MIERLPIFGATGDLTGRFLLSAIVGWAGPVRSLNEE